VTQWMHQTPGRLFIIALSTPFPAAKAAALLGVGLCWASFGGGSLRPAAGAVGVARLLLITCC
jgi:hypothetical protein